MYYQLVHVYVHIHVRHTLYRLFALPARTHRLHTMSELATRTPEMEHCLSKYQLWGLIHNLPNCVALRRHNFARRNPNRLSQLRELKRKLSNHSSSTSAYPDRNPKIRQQKKIDQFLRRSTLEEQCYAQGNELQLRHNKARLESTPTENFQCSGKAWREFSKTQSTDPRTASRKWYKHAKSIMGALHFAEHWRALKDECPPTTEEGTTTNTHALYASIRLRELQYSKVRIVDFPPYIHALNYNIANIRPILLMRISASGLGQHRQTRLCFDELPAGEDVTYACHYAQTESECRRRRETLTHVMTACPARRPQLLQLKDSITQWHAANIAIPQKQIEYWWPEKHHHRRYLLLGLSPHLHADRHRAHTQATPHDQWAHVLKAIAKYFRTLTYHAVRL